MLGVLVNTLTVLIGSSVGLIFRKGIPDKVTGAAMTGIGLCTMYIGIDGLMAGQNVLILIASTIIGVIIGTLLDIDGKINGLGRYVEKHFGKKDGKTPVAQGFVTASLLFCIGSMTIVGSLESGLTGDNSMIYTKSLLDLISSSMLAATLGYGVLIASAFVFVFQGALVLLAGLLKPLLTDAAIAEMICSGSLIILALGLNITGITKIKVADFLPAIFVAPIICFMLTIF